MCNMYQEFYWYGLILSFNNRFHIIPILSTRKLRPKEIELLVQVISQLAKPGIEPWPFDSAAWCFSPLHHPASEESTSTLRILPKPTNTVQRETSGQTPRRQLTFPDILCENFTNILIWSTHQLQFLPSFIIGESETLNRMVLPQGQHSLPRSRIKISILTIWVTMRTSLQKHSNVGLGLKLLTPWVCPFNPDVGEILSLWLVLPTPNWAAEQQLKCDTLKL